MSLRPFQALEDFLSSYDESPQAQQDAAASDDGSSSVMFAGDGISTDSTTDLTASITPTTTTAASPIPSVGGDYYDPTVTGLTPGTFVEFYREQLSRNNVVGDDDDDDAANLLADNNDGNSSMTSAISEFGGTIVSSAASSGYRVEAPPLESSWAMTSAPPHRPIHRDHVSISTTESMYRELASLEGEEDAYSILSSLQLSSMTDHSLIDVDTSDTYSSCTITGGQDESQQQQPLQRLAPSSASATTVTHMQLTTTTTHDRTSFSNVADRMALLRHQDDKSSGKWFARFTEQDWLAFRRDADMVMAALHDSSGPALLPLPPAAPMLVESSSSSSFDTTTNNNNSIEGPYQHASDALSSAFICPLCNDAIVGATTLDCTCPQSTMCLSCWEGYRTNMLDNNNDNDNNSSSDDNEELEDLVHVHQKKCCPFCQKTIHNFIACYALDMAVLHCIKALPDGHGLQRAYYHRLTNWRAEVKRRRTESRTKKANQRDLLLAELIQQEEDYFWTKESKEQLPFWHAHRAQLVMVGEVALLVAAAALTGSGAVRGFLSRR